MKKIFTTKGPGKPTYRHTWNRDDNEELASVEGDGASLRPSQSQPSMRVSPEKRKQPTSSQEHLICKSKVSRTIVSRQTSDDKVQEEETCTQIRCSKSEKGYFTVVKNVKEARQCHEWGEAQEILADIEYLLGSVVDSENHRVKCLSVINIATKCQSAQFRAHLRAHGSSMKLFAALTDAPKHPSLAICTACVIYLMARDRLGITVDQKTLELIVDLVNLLPNDGHSASQQTEVLMDQSESDDDYETYRMRVWKILNEWRQHTDAAAAAASQTISGSQRSADGNETVPPTMMFDITLENLSARFLAIEALTFICCRTHDDSFRKWMRESRGLNSIAQYFTKEADAILVSNPDSGDYCSIDAERIKMLERYLRILEHASLMNQQNQAYLVVWESSSLVFTCAKLFKYFKSLLDQANVDDIGMSQFIKNLSTKSIITVLMAVLKTLLNLSHSNVLCCGKLGDYDRFIGDCVDFATCTIPEHIQPSGRYDLLVLSLGLLINLVEPCNANRRLAIAYAGRKDERTLTVLTKKEYLEILALAVKELSIYGKRRNLEHRRMFLFHDAAAQATDDEVEKVIESSQELQGRNGGGEATEADVQETVAAALKTASKHMEDSIVAAHIALFLGLVLQQNEDAIDEITSVMPDGKFEPLIAMLQKFLDFMRLTKAVGRTGEKAISKAIETFEHLG